MNIVIKKAKIKNSLFLYYEFDQVDVDVKNENKTNSNAPIHEDLRNAFKGLIPHLVALCELHHDVDLIESAIERPESYVQDPETSASNEFFKFTVNEVSFDYKSGNNIVSISGNKLLTSLEDIGIDCPPVDLNSSKYPYLSQLIDALEVLKSQVLAYMQGKYGEGHQVSMFDMEEEIDDDGQDATLKVVKGSKKAKAKANAAFTEE